MGSTGYNRPIPKYRLGKIRVENPTARIPDDGSLGFTIFPRFAQFVDMAMLSLFQKTKPIHLIMGVSSAGKSSYILSGLKTGRWTRDLPVFMAHELETKCEDAVAEECIVHYDLFRPTQHRLEQAETDFLSDPVLAAILHERKRVKASVLLARKATLAKRILLRTAVEPDLREHSLNYPAEQIFELLCGIDLPAFCLRWFELLDKQNIEYEIIEIETGNYDRLGFAEEAVRWLNQKSHQSYKPQEIDTIKQRYRFEYQAISLPGSGKTSGDDRSGSLRIIEGFFHRRSVLDIGCAYGFFVLRRRSEKLRTWSGPSLSVIDTSEPLS